jgi:hypothetical protein
MISLRFFSIPITSVLLFVSCESHSSKNQKILNLEREVDSLKHVIQSNKIFPYIDNKRFMVTVDSLYRLQLIAAIQNGIELQSLEINGQDFEESNQNVELKFDDFGPHIFFRPNRIGKFSFKAITNIKAWGPKQETLVEWEVDVNHLNLK